MVEPLTSQAWVAAWLQRASHDLETAHRALHAGFPITDTAAYHCHQAVSELSSFGTVLRYPSVDADPTVGDVTAALQTAQQFHAFVSAIVGDRQPIK